ncbi:hypothetical protein F2981_14880 [Sinorhizobium meliloti]|nr:hypothetical protein [Sinorhizobium meliloti]
MLFDSARRGPVMMWMKNTYLPLDMLSWRVTASYRTFTRTRFRIPKPLSIPGTVAYVLELNGRNREATRISPGDRPEGAGLPAAERAN